ncbi:NACHT domain-containing protein [Agrobacterium sp. NPDC090273]|uniref:NACHT domain-containing protein n=1 Tax=Agrobacterium sp. NPDC090273 TaxID=3363919 RepID=UPI00383B3DD1
MLVATVLFGLTACGLFAYIVWMKWKQRYSKPRFAYYTVITLFSLVLFITGAITAVDWLEATTSLLAILGLPVPVLSTTGQTIYIKIAEKVLVSLVGVTGLVAIMKFAKRAVMSWEGPITVNTARLHEEGRADDLIALAYVELNRRIQKHNDPIIDARTLDWKQVIAQAPEREEFRDLARVALTNHFPEIVIEDNGWRQKLGAWIGIVHGAKIGDDSQLVVFVFEEVPTVDELAAKIDEIGGGEGQIIKAVIDAPVPQDLQDCIIRGVKVEAFQYNQLLRSGLPLQGYARQLIKQFRLNTVGGTQTTLAGTFVPAKVTDRDGVSSSLANIVKEWILDTGRKHLAITGEYGQGKSTAMLHLCVQWAERYLNDEAQDERIPLLLELRGKSPGENSPLELLAQWGARYSLSGEKLFALIRSGQVLIIFEGFDELKNAGREFERHEHFNALWRFAYPGTKLIFTGRPNFFIDQSERNSTLRIDDSNGAASNAYTQMYSINMFDEADVRQACRAYPEDVRDGIMDTFYLHPDFREIVMRPSMLPVVATIWPEIRNAEKEGHEITGSMLLEKYLSAVYARKEAELENDRVTFLAPELSSYLLLPRSIREALTLAVVWEMAVQDFRNTIPRTSFDLVINRVFDGVLRAMQSKEVRTPVSEAARKLQLRLQSENRIEFLEKVCTDVASAGLFVPDPVGGDSNLRFAHKQYFEYLIAKFAWLRLSLPESEIVTAISSGKTAFKAETLWSSDAIFPLIRLIDGNLSCFSRSAKRIKMSLFLENISDFTSDAIRKVMIAVVKKKAKTISEIDFASLDAPQAEERITNLRSLYVKRIVAIALASAGLIVSLASIIFSILKTGSSFEVLFAFLPVMALPGLTLVLTRTISSSAAVELFFDYCRMIRIQSGEELRNNLTTIQHIQKTCFALIQNPERRINISEAVTGVSIPAHLTNPRSHECK